jgi:hypothetical protein
MRRADTLLFKVIWEDLMTDAGTPTPTAEDIAYVRKLAESGANAPLTGGRFMAWWGGMVSLAYLAHHLALHGVIGDPKNIFGIIWLTFVAVSLVGQFVLVKTMPAKPGGGSPGNRASASVWGAAAGAISAFLVGCVILSARGAGFGIFDMVVPLGFAVYACCLIVTGALAGSRLTQIAGFGAILTVGIYTALLLEPDRYLIAAAGAALTVFLPGLLLLRAEPRAQG